ncbi:hypothetical protein DFJ69_0335 [Thermomonospora umbrina]|uniref:Uncharacterized protein n=1 Tax=Thermomonospora umbrina TaxID=111806 RepID=A0A3D9SGC9_9ACTN|nr:hypothetical protein DFJ69_0335 [Thermomonospora umbrina]
MTAGSTDARADREEITGAMGPLPTPIACPRTPVERTTPMRDHFEADDRMSVVREARERPSS